MNETIVIVTAEHLLDHHDRYSETVHLVTCSVMTLLIAATNGPIIFFLLKQSVKTFLDRQTCKRCLTVLEVEEGTTTTYFLLVVRLWLSQTVTNLASSSPQRVHCVHTEQLSMSVLYASLFCRTAELTNRQNGHAQKLREHATHFPIPL